MSESGEKNSGYIGPVSEIFTSTQHNVYAVEGVQSASDTKSAAHASMTVMIIISENMEHYRAIFSGT